MSIALLTIDAATHILTAVPAAIPDPGAGTAPAGAAAFNTLLGNLKWICLGVCVAALLVAGAGIAWAQHHTGNGAEVLGKIGYVALGVFIIAGAVGLISTFAGTGTTGA